MYFGHHVFNLLVAVLENELRKQLQTFFFLFQLKIGRRGQQKRKQQQHFFFSRKKEKKNCFGFRKAA